MPIKVKQDDKSTVITLTKDFHKLFNLLIRLHGFTATGLADCSLRIFAHTRITTILAVDEYNQLQVFYPHEECLKKKGAWKHKTNAKKVLKAMKNSDINKELNKEIFDHSNLPK